ncbi:MAG: FKBP-type peptidyl-prolyl cis-trans isomerase [Luteibaculaceae bacterium]
MKNKFLLALSGLFILSACNSDIPGNKPVNMEVEEQKLGYAIGVQVGIDIKEGVENIDLNALLVGLNDAFSESAKLTRDEALQVVNEYFIAMQEKEMAKGKEEGTAFLAEIAATEGINQTESGLMYEVLEMGSGEKPSATSTVTVHYEGTLKNGEIFDSSYSRGEPTKFGVNQVIKGWTEGLQLMPVGSKFKFYIPSDLAYGERGAGQMIGPNEPLVFTVELIGIE